MSTRSRVAYMWNDGSVVSIYCHHDGYLSGVGQTLLDNYTTPEAVRVLLELGDISVLDESTDSTVAYHRNRGEALNPGRQDKNVKELVEHSEEFTYVYNPLTRQWFYDDHGKSGIPLPRLTQSVIDGNE